MGGGARWRRGGVRKRSDPGEEGAIGLGAGSEVTGSGVTGSGAGSEGKGEELWVR